MMQEALTVNPYAIDDSAEILHRALSMPRDEREVRMLQLRRRESYYDVNFWMKSFLKVRHLFSFKTKFLKRFFFENRPWEFY